MQIPLTCEQKPRLVGNFRAIILFSHDSTATVIPGASEMSTRPHVLRLLLVHVAWLGSNGSKECLPVRHMVHFSDLRGDGNCMELHGLACMQVCFSSLASMRQGKAWKNGKAKPKYASEGLAKLGVRNSTEHKRVSFLGWAIVFSYEIMFGNPYRHRFPIISSYLV